MQDINHSTRKHAILSASGASRWINCTPSPRLEEGFEVSQSEYAAEGTLAHEFAELGVKLDLGLMHKKDYDKATKPLRKHHLYYDTMEEEVQKHIDYVLEQFLEAKRVTSDAVILIEAKVDLTHYIEDGFGTCDIVIIADGVLEVIDLKFGKGVRVSAKDNPQLKLYGLGALRANELLYDIKTVKLTIVQPRLDSISSWEISSEELIHWGESVVIPKAKLAFDGKGEQVTGEWCRFCRAKAVCKALAQESLDLAKHEFQEPMLLSDNELLDAYSKIDKLQTWANAVADYIFKEALSGKKWEGYKLVEGRSNRQWVDQEKVAEVLIGKNFSESDLFTKKLLGIGAIEKMLGKSAFSEYLGDLVIKPQGKPTLVPESDKRNELSNAKNDFSDD